MPPASSNSCGVGVAHDPARLAGVGPGDDRAVLGQAEQGVLVAGDGAGLGRGDEAGADPHAVGAERERGGQAPPVEDAAGRDDRHLVADRVDDLGDERHGRDLAGVAAGLGALGDDDVAAGLDRRDGVAHLAAHVDDEHVAAVAEVDDVAGHAEPGDEHGGAAVDDVVDLGLHVLGAAVRRSTPNGLSVSVRTVAISSTISSCRMVEAPRQPKPPASDTAATRRWYETPPMPASITGCSMSRISVSRVRIRRMVRVGPRRHPVARTRRGASGGAWRRWPGARPRTASGRSCAGSSRSTPAARSPAPSTRGGARAPGGANVDMRWSASRARRTSRS